MKLYEGWTEECIVEAPAEAKRRTWDASLAHKVILAMLTDLSEKAEATSRRL